jgi:hypothetical protein
MLQNDNGSIKNLLMVPGESAYGSRYEKMHGIPRNFTEFSKKFIVKMPRNSAKFRGIPCILSKIPSEVKKPLPWTPYH